MVVAATLLGLVVVHMTRTRFRRREVSVARFFLELPPPAESQRRIELSNPLLSLSLYPQAALLALVLAALLALVRGCRPPAEKDLGLWVIIDTSSSMTTTQDGVPRLALARQEARTFLDRAAGTAGSISPCLGLSSFDMEVREHLPPSRAAGLLGPGLERLEARPLGSELGSLRQALVTAAATTTELPATGDEEQTACRPTHRLIITDLPAPDWISDLGATTIWRDISQPVDNAGITDLTAERDLLSGNVRALTVTVTAHGRPPAGARLQLTSPSGTVSNEPVAWLKSGVWRLRLPQPVPGHYQLVLSPGGAYTSDDQATVAIATGSTIRVDWRLPSQRLPGQLGWQADPQQPQLRVVPLSEAASGLITDLPGLVVGDHYGRGPGGEITRFEEGDPLLDGLNLDVAERLQIAGVTPPPGFTPVLAAADGAWVARRDEPRGVYLPGLPAASANEDQQHFAATLLINSLRWLLAGAEPAPLYTLTSPAHTEPAGTRLALHPGEGRTDHAPVSSGGIEAIRPLSRHQEPEPAWPWLLALAATFLALEQGLAAFGGARWR
jgi:hypothetical protein